jgi:hypothetical protein
LRTAEFAVEGVLDARMGPLGKFLWAFTLKHENGNVTGFRSAAAMAIACGHLLYAVKVTILYFRAQETSKASLEQDLEQQPQGLIGYRFS